MSAVVGFIAIFGPPTTAIPAVAMLAAAVLFFASLRINDGGMMIIRALGVLAVASFVRAMSVFVGATSWTNAISTFVIWLWLAGLCVMAIRMLITWGIVVRPPRHRW